MNRFGTAGIAVTVAAIAGLAGFFAFRGGSGPPPPESPLAPAATVHADGGPGTSPPPREEPKPIPEVLPDFELATREGPTRRLSSYQHPIMVVNFWATWCAPCRREIPLLRQLRRDRADQGVEIIGVAVDFREEVLRYADEIGLDYPLLIGEQDGLEAVQAFGLDMMFPATVFADAQRRIIAVRIGELHADEADFILDRIHEINRGSLTPEAARPAIAEKLRELAAKRAQKTPDSEGTTS